MSPVEQVTITSAAASAAGDAPPREMAEILERLRGMDAGGGRAAEGPEVGREEDTV